MDECKDVNRCSSRATCINYPHTFQCLCNSGFLDAKGDGTDCRDVDECLHGSGMRVKILIRRRDFFIQPWKVCPDMSTCNNTIGSYECPCMTGYEFT